MGIGGGVAQPRLGHGASGRAYHGVSVLRRDKGGHIERSHWKWHVSSSVLPSMRGNREWDGFVEDGCTEIRVVDRAHRSDDAGGWPLVARDRPADHISQLGRGPVA